MTDSLSESACRRSWKDTKAAWTNWPFVVVSAVVSIVLFLIGLLVLAWYWGVGFAALAILGVWAYEIISAPYKQRNEARKQIMIVQNEGKSKIKGKFFHDFDEEGYVRHQGHIVDFINDDIAVIQYFEWGMGEPSATKMVYLRDIIEGGWALYSSDEEMRDALEYGHVKQRR